MANARDQLERALARFTDELIEIVQTAVAEAIAEGQAPAPKARGRGRTAARATAPTTTARAPRRRQQAPPDLDGRILLTLRGAGESLSVSELQKRLDAPRGALTYALRKLKASGDIRQEGERRFARYRIG